MRIPHALRARLYRLVLVATLALLTVQLAWRHKAAIETSKAAVAPVKGDTLSNEGVLSFKGAAATAGASSLQSLMSTKCVLLVFFDSQCSVCQTIAPSWKGRRNIVVDSDTVPVRWIAISPRDTGATAFIRRYDLAEEWYVLKSPSAFVSLGIAGTPFLYLVDGRRTLLEQTRQHPKDIKTLPPACKETAAVVHA